MEMIIVVIMIIVIVMISFINNSCYSDLDSNFLNCYFLKFFCVIRFFFFNFIIFFFFIEIEFHDFSRLDASCLITRITSLKKLSFIIVFYF